jgi:tetratricopeptide (TPR) repeat protein
LLRREAAENYMADDSAGLLRILVPLLGDPIKTVRMEAAYRLSTYKKDAFSETQYRLFSKALEEYKRSLEYLADFPSGRFNLGNYYSKTNDLPGAEENYLEAIALDNLFYPAKINLAMLYYQQGKIEPAEKLFQNLIAVHPEVPEGYYYLALLYGEQKRYPEAIALLETASTKQGTNPRIWYNLALLYQMTGQNGKCEETFLKGLRQDPCNYDLLYAIYSFYMNHHDRGKAAPIVVKLKSCYPGNKAIQELQE